MLALVLSTALATEPPPLCSCEDLDWREVRARQREARMSQPVSEREPRVRPPGTRVQMPSIEFGLGSVVRHGSDPGVWADLGVHALESGPLDVRFGMGFSSRRWVNVFEGDYGWGGLRRSLFGSAIDVGVGWHLHKQLVVEGVGGLSWQGYRQQWRPIDVVMSPFVGVGVAFQGKFGGIRLRAMSDFRRVALFREDGSSVKLAPIRATATLFFRIPGTKRPLRGEE